MAFGPQVAAKMPGHVHCYKDVCHRVKTIAETEDLIGKRLVIKTSHYDSPERDPYNVGRYTSSGEEFDAENSSRAASAHFPDGTELLVWNPLNGRASHLRINDFGPFHTDRTLDVTRSAAEKLGFAERGVLKLRVYVVAAPDTDWPRYELARSYPPTEGFLGVIPRDQLVDVVIELAARVKRRRSALPPVPPDEPSSIPPPPLTTASFAVPTVSQARVLIRNMQPATPTIRVAGVGDHFSYLRSSVGTKARVYKISVDARPAWVRTKIPPPMLLSAITSAGLVATFTQRVTPPVVAQAKFTPDKSRQLLLPTETAQPGIWQSTLAAPTAVEAVAHYAHVPTNNDVVTLLGYEEQFFAAHLRDQGAETLVAALNPMAQKRVATVYGRDLTVEFPAFAPPSAFQLSIPALLIVLTILTWLLVGRNEQMVEARAATPDPFRKRVNLKPRLWSLRAIVNRKPDAIEMVQPPPIPKKHMRMQKTAAHQDPVPPPLAASVALEQAAANTTVIGAGATLVGQITSASEVVVSGTFDGPCTARLLEVAEGGKVTGNVDTVDLVVGGELKADVQTGHVHVTRTGKIDGDVNYDKISMEAGGVLAARCQRMCTNDQPDQQVGVVSAESPREL